MESRQKFDSKINAIEDSNLIVKLDIIELQDNCSDLNSRISTTEDKIKLLEEAMLSLNKTAKKKELKEISPENVKNAI